MLFHTTGSWITGLVTAEHWMRFDREVPLLNPGKIQSSEGESAYNPRYF